MIIDKWIERIVQFAYDYWPHVVIIIGALFLLWEAIVTIQWLINERARSASLGERILELEQRVRQLETSLWAALEQER